MEIYLISAMLIVAAVLFISEKYKNKALRRELQKAREEKEEALKDGDEALIQFHSAIAHGMRMPISIISGYADLLQGGLISDEEVRREYLSKICERTDYMNSLFNQLLTNARADSELYELITAPLDITALVKQTASDISSAASKIGVNIHVEEPDETVIIEADVIQLTKVFYNVIENSMKYMGRSGEIEITISRSGRDVLIVFSDDGKGLNEEELNKIFDLSYQGSNSKQGSGMGLHLAKLSVSAHGGEIYAKSNENQGMKIFICLPVKTEKSDKLKKCKILSNL